MATEPRPLAWAEGSRTVGPKILRSLLHRCLAEPRVSTNVASGRSRDIIAPHAAFHEGLARVGQLSSGVAGPEPRIVSVGSRVVFPASRGVRPEMGLTALRVGEICPELRITGKGSAVVRPGFLVSGPVYPVSGPVSLDTCPGNLVSGPAGEMSGPASLVSGPAGRTT